MALHTLAAIYFRLFTFVLILLSAFCRRFPAPVTGFSERTYMNCLHEWTMRRHVAISSNCLIMDSLLFWSFFALMLTRFGFKSISISCFRMLQNSRQDVRRERFEYSSFLWNVISDWSGRQFPFFVVCLRKEACQMKASFVIKKIILKNQLSVLSCRFLID